jgi:hypothetical protein
MQKRFCWMYAENGDLNQRGVVFIVVLSIVVALFLDVFVHAYSTYADTLKYEPRYTIQEITSMGYVKIE